jgi:hypothetical protein
MLAVDDGFAECSFAGLEEERVAAFSDGGGLEAEHGSEQDCSSAGRVCGGEHSRVGGEELVASARSFSWPWGQLRDWCSFQWLAARRCLIAGRKQRWIQIEL